MFKSGSLFGKVGGFFAGAVKTAVDLPGNLRSAGDRLGDAIFGGLERANDSPTAQYVERRAVEFRTGQIFDTLAQNWHLVAVAAVALYLVLRK